MTNERLVRPKGPDRTYRTLGFPPVLYKRMERYAKRNGLSRSKVIELALEKFLDAGGKKEEGK